MKNRGQRVDTKRFLTALGMFLAVLALWQGSAAADNSMEEARGLIRIVSNAAEGLPEDINEPVTRRQFVSAAVALFQEADTAAAPAVYCAGSGGGNGDGRRWSCLSAGGAHYPG